MTRWLLAALLLIAPTALSGSLETPGGTGGGVSNFSELTDDVCASPLFMPRRNGTDTGWECIAAPGGGDAFQSGTLNQFAATSANQFAVVMSEFTGSGTFVRSNSPALVTPNLGTPSALVGTNITGTAAGLTVGVVTSYTNMLGELTCIGLVCDFTGTMGGGEISLASQADGNLMFYEAGASAWIPVGGTAMQMLRMNAAGDAPQFFTFTESQCFPFYAPNAGIQATDDVQSVWRSPTSITITEVWCETDTGSVTMDLQVDDGSPADIMGADLVCDATSESDSAGLSGVMAVGDRIDFAITSIGGAPTRVTACIRFTR